MSSNNIYTKRLSGIDKNVWWVLLAAIIIPAGFLGYRVITKKSCTPVEYTIKALSADTGNVFQAGETILFNASSNTDEITWQFGEKGEQRTGKNVFYSFKNTGDYFITASTGLGCESIKKIVIIPAKVDSAEDIIKGNIIGPGITITGKETSYKYSGDAKSYEWIILNYPKYNQKGPEARFNFSEKGTYTLQLTMDNDRSKRLIKTIKVDKISVGNDGGGSNPPPPPSPTCVSTFISDAALAKLLQKVVDGEYTVNNFDPYLSSRGATPVIINKKNENKDFAYACKFLNGKKKTQKLLWKRKVDITGVRVVRDSNSCVTLIEINYD